MRNIMAEHQIQPDQSAQPCPPAAAQVMHPDISQIPRDHRRRVRRP